MMRTTLEIITRTMFSTSVLDRIDELSPALLTALRYASAHLINPALKYTRLGIMGHGQNRWSKA